MIAAVVGNLLGILAAWRRGGAIDSALPPVLVFIGSVPYFWLAMGALYLFGGVLGWFPIRHAFPAGLEPAFTWEFIGDVGAHLVLPALTIVLVSIGGWMLGMRNTMIATNSEDYITMAEAKGLRPGRIMLRYAARNAMLPSVTSFGMGLGFVVGGALLTEADTLNSYPHELSGGQRQRVAIARALAVEPQVILADEPTSMLDVSVRSGVLNLMRKLRDEQGISMLYITHDLASARYLADRTAVMFAGELVEEGESLDLLAHPAHPYTQLLVSAVPDPARASSYDPVHRAELRQAVMASTSCAFDGDPNQPCSAEEPVRHRVGDPENHHWVRCHLYQPRAGSGGHALATEPTDKKASA